MSIFFRANVCFSLANKLNYDENELNYEPNKSFRGPKIPCRGAKNRAEESRNLEKSVTFALLNIEFIPKMDDYHAENYLY